MVVLLHVLRGMDRKPRHQSEPLPPRAGSEYSESGSEEEQKGKGKGKEKERVDSGPSNAQRGNIRTHAGAKEHSRTGIEDEKMKALRTETASEGSRRVKETLEVS